MSDKQNTELWVVGDAEEALARERGLHDGAVARVHGGQRRGRVALAGEIVECGGCTRILVAGRGAATDFTDEHGFEYMPLSVSIREIRG